MMRMNQEQDLWDYVEVRGPDDCWEWQGHTNGSGYGRMRIRTRQTLAHRVSYKIATGMDAGEMLVCHHCDNRLCCNPAHLFLGTIADNTRDAHRKGRLVCARGSKHWCAKLNEELVSRIRERHAAGENLRDLAREYGVVETTIYGVVTRRTWRHI